MPEFLIEYLDPEAPDVQALVAASDAYYDGLYPAESTHLEDIDDLQKPNALFIGCRCDGELAASSAAKQMEDDDSYAEIKRVFVLDQFRGHGLSAKLMIFLENELQRHAARPIIWKEGQTPLHPKASSDEHRVTL